MRLLSSLTRLTWAVLAALPGTTLAEGLDLTFSGYGTLAATYADTHEAQFRASWRQDRGSRGQVDLGVDSRLGAQLNASLDETFSGVAQLLASRRDGGNQLAVEWLYGQAEIGPHTAIRVGRLAIPAFMLSDTRNVGYAQHWAQTPAEMYLAFPSIDGAQLLYRNSWEGIKFTVQPSMGGAKTQLFYELTGLGQVSAPTEFRNLLGLNLSAEKGDWSARFGQTITDATISWSIFPPEDLKYTFTSVGLQYDNGSLLVMAEQMNGKTDSGRYDIAGRYVSAGYRFGPWMPYATYADLQNKGTVVQALPRGRTIALGMRWDAVKDVAIKAQVERSRLSGQQFTNVDPMADKGRSVNVYTLAIDFVF